jgi:hypothetical protein
LLARRKQTVPPDRMAEIGFIEGFAAQIASSDRDNPRMAGDGGAAERSLIACRRRHDHPALWARSALEEGCAIAALMLSTCAPA